jgi:hypothetical protein
MVFSSPEVHCGGSMQHKFPYLVVFERIVVTHYNQNNVPNWGNSTIVKTTLFYARSSLDTFLTTLSFVLKNRDSVAREPPLEPPFVPGKVRLGTLLRQ